MFGKKPTQTSVKLETVKQRLLDDMIDFGPDTEEYTNNLGYLERVHALQNTKQRVSPDQILLVVGNLLGILILVGYEQKHVLTSRALPLVMKTK